MFTALVSDLMGVGFPGAQALAVGNIVSSVTAAGSTQGAGTVIGKGVNQLALITTSSTDYAVTIDSGMPVGQGVIVTNINASIYAASVFPPTGCTIDGGSSNAAITLSGNETAYVYRTSTTAFRSMRLPRSGMIPTAATCTGTAQVGGVAVLANRAYQLTTSVGQTAATIDANVPIGGTLEVYTITATTALLFPPSGCTIDQGAADASVNVAHAKGRIIRRMTATAFNTVLSA